MFIETKNKEKRKAPEERHVNNPIRFNTCLGIVGAQHKLVINHSPLTIL